MATRDEASRKERGGGDQNGSVSRGDERSTKKEQPESVSRWRPGGVVELGMDMDKVDTIVIRQTFNYRLRPGWVPFGPSEIGSTSPCLVPTLA